MDDALSTRSDARERYPFIEFYFHRAVRDLREGERPDSRKLFESAISIDNPVNGSGPSRSRSREQVQQLIPCDLPGGGILSCRDGRHCHY
jgi:hypothetical protein